MVQGEGLLWLFSGRIAVTTAAIAERYSLEKYIASATVKILLV
jgi:hypothetical protein